MAIQLAASDLELLISEARQAARRLVRRFRLPWHQLDDLRQDLLLDLIARLPAYDSQRGTLGAFAGTILTHKAARLANGIGRQRALFGAIPISLDESVHERDGTTRGDLVAEDEGLAACLGHPVDAFARIERRLDVERALGALRPSDSRLCAALCRATADRLAAKGHGARSSLYRRVKQIRLELMAAGLRASA